MTDFEWLPMSQAPKDGTWILAINNRGNCAVIIWRENPANPRDRDFGTGWIHPFTDMRLSPFWNGGCGSVPVAWCQLPHGERARHIVEEFTAVGRPTEKVG